LAGQINLNTVWDPEILQALCDPQESNYFTADDVQATFDQLLVLRSAGSRNPYALGPNDRPFLSMAAGYSMGDTPANMGQGIDPQHPTRGIGINDTFLRAGLHDTQNNAFADQKGPEGGWSPAERYPRLFQTSKWGGQTPLFNQPIDEALHPYFHNQMLTKMFNHLTTRSNVFAIWVTVGFFKVTDDTVRPVKLGAEIGKSEGRHIRHRMFAIVDRSNLTIAQDATGKVMLGQPPIFLSGGVWNPEPTSTPRRPLSFTIDGAEYDEGNPLDPYDDKLVGFYEGNRWEIRGDHPGTPANEGTALVFSYGNDPTTGQTTEGFPIVLRVVREDLPTNKPPTFEVDPQKPPGDPYFVPRTQPFVIAMTDQRPGPTKGQPIRLGNPGPQQRFNPREYPWIVRYFSVIE
jgi:hypothetical protein